MSSRFPRHAEVSNMGRKGTEEQNNFKCSSEAESPMDKERKLRSKIATVSMFHSKISFQDHLY